MLSVFLHNTELSNEVWELPTDSVHWDEELNAVRTGQFSVNFLALRQLADSLRTTVDYILRAGPRQVEIRDDTYGYDPLLFRGLLRDYQLSSTNEGASTISLNFADFGLMLSQRVSREYAFYDQVRAAQIFKTELDWANIVCDTDLRLGELPANTTKRQRTVERTNLLDLLTGMSNSKTNGGFDFAIDNDGHINLYQDTRGIQQPDIVLDTRNSMQAQVAGKLTGGLCNRVYVQGGELTDSNGNVTQEAQMVIVEDVQSQMIWGLHEQYLSATDIATTPFLQARGQEVLRQRAWPRSTETATVQHLGDDPDWRSYQVGDWLHIEWPDYNINELMRVTKRTVTWEDGVYKIGLTLSRELT